MAFAPNVLVADGDSITVGFGVTTPWPQLLSINGSNPWNIVNVAVNGETLATMLANAAADVDPLYVSGVGNICVIWGGTNDIADGATAIATYANLTSYIAARHVVGWKVITITMLSRVSVSNTAYNALILANTAGADAVVNLSGEPLGSPTDYSNTTYFQVGGIHPTTLSVDTIIAPAINTAINSLNVTGPTISSITPVQIVRGFSISSGAANLTYPDNNGQGNLLLGLVAWGANAPNTAVADSQHNNWQNSGVSLVIGGTFTLEIWYAENCVAGYNTVSFTESPDAGYKFVATAEFASGSSRPLVLDKTTGNTGSGTSLSSGTVTLSDAVELLIGNLFSKVSNISPSGTYILGDAPSGFTGWEYQVSANTGPWAATGTSGSSDPWGAALATFNIEPQVVTPVISPTAGAYDGSVNVTISCSTPGSSIYYTTDGSTPTSGSTPYTPFTVDSSLTVKAIAIDSGYVNSAVASSAYTLTYTISGSAGVAGATVTYAGTTSGSVVADGSGNYSISGLPNLWTGTVTPSKTGYTFSPANSSQTINSGDNTGVNFTAKLSYSNHRSK
jgi:hypothetical protein